MADNKGRINYYCQYCGSKCRSIDTIKKHLIKCIEENNKLKEDVDYVICKICNFHAQNLGIHLKKVHNILSDDYKKQYNCNTTSDVSNKKYSENHFEYLKNAKENNVNLTKYWEKVSAGVSAAILSNPKELERRSNMMIVLNKIQQSNPLFKKIVSNTAKKTSSRSDIIISRSENLKKWRDENPEDFYNKCIAKMINSFQSKPEKILFEHMKLFGEFNFIRNQFVKSILFLSKTNKKQIDIADKEKRIYIEFDGRIHFIPYYGEDLLREIQTKDLQLDNHILNHNWTLIRVSYDEFVYKTKIINKIKQDNSYFKQECLDKILEILNSKITGIYKIGGAYGKY